jgi:hypothetical protein
VQVIENKINTVEEQREDSQEAQENEDAAKEGWSNPDDSYYESNFSDLDSCDEL